MFDLSGSSGQILESVNGHQTLEQYS